MKIDTKPGETIVIVTDEIEIFEAAVIKLSPKYTKCDLAYHFILDFEDDVSNFSIMKIICRDWTICQRDIFDILPDWERGVYIKEKKCADT